MGRMRVSTIVLGALCATPALAHPGHGMAGWLHHGEVLAAALVLLGALVARRWRSRSGALAARGAVRR